MEIAPGSEKRDFVKMWLFLKRQYDFEGSDPSKIDENLCKIRAETATRKKTRSETDFKRF